MAVQAQKIKIPKAKSYNPWMHAFRLGIKQNAAVTVVATIVFLLLYAALPAVILITGNTGLGNHRVDYSYLFIYAAMLSPQLFPVLALASALLQGVLSFRFLHGRKSSIAWMSLGLSRSDLFWSKLASGAAGALLPVVVSLTVTLGFNLALSPTVGLVLARYSFFLIGMCLQILVLYSITVAVCVHVATRAEAAVYSFTLCLLPSVVIAGVNAMMERLLFGTPYVPSEWFQGPVNTTLLGTLSGWNPLFFMYPYMAHFGGALQNINSWDMKLYAMLQPSSVNWLIPLAWAVAAAAIIWLARWLFLRRKPETAGRMGAGRALGALCVLTVGFAAFGVVYSLPFYLPKNIAFWVPFLSASGVALAAMLVTALPLRLFKQPRWHGFATVFGGLAVMAALVGIFISGGLGYSDYVPDVKNVKSATVSYNGMNHFVQEFEADQNGILLDSISFSPCVTLSNEGDIEVLADIHRKLIGAGRLDPVGYTVDSPSVFNTVMRIQYTLKSGAVVARTYRGMTAGLVKSVIALDDTAGVKQAYANAILHPVKDIMRTVAYYDGPVYLCSPLGSAIAPLILSASTRAEFLQCLADDLSAQPSSDRYLPDSLPVGVIEFVPGGNGSMQQLTERLLYRGTDPVYVTRRFTRTLAFMDAHAIRVPTDKTAEQIEVYEYADQHIPFGLESSGAMPLFAAEYITAQAAEDYKKRIDRKMTVTDPMEIKNILDRCRSVYLISEGGYPVLIKLKDSDQYVTAFLPASAAPEFVKEGAK